MKENDKEEEEEDLATCESGSIGVRCRIA